jgi:Berberine and berberine like
MTRTGRGFPSSRWSPLQAENRGRGDPSRFARLRVREDATAFAHRHELFSLKHTATVASDSSQLVRDAAQRWLTKSWRTVQPWGSGRVFPNFPDPDLENWRHAYYGTNYQQLLRVKATYDPDNIFRFHQSLPNPGAAAPAAS